MNELSLTISNRIADKGSISVWSKEVARTVLCQWKQSGMLPEPALYSVGAMIFDRKTESQDLFLLEKGLVVFEREEIAKDRSGVFGLCSPGHLFGQSAEVPSLSNPYSAIALTRCSIYRIGKERVLMALQEGGEPALFIVRQLLRNLLCVRAQATESTVKPAKVRFQQLLVELASVLEDRSPTGSIRMPLKDKELASLLGISPQQFSVIKRDLEAERVITCSGERNRLALRSVSGTLRFFKVHRYKRMASVA
jgi:CRP-like cAMP-binding protein